MTNCWNKDFRIKNDENLFKEIESIDTTNYNTQAEIREYIKIMAILGELNRRNSERQSKSSTRGMIVSIALATVSILISIFLGFTANQSSQEWQTKQLPQLEAINKNTRSISDFSTFIKTKGINYDRK